MRKYAKIEYRIYNNTFKIYIQKYTIKKVTQNEKSTQRRNPKRIKR